jgi:hypothetical protein
MNKPADELLKIARELEFEAVSSYSRDHDSAASVRNHHLVNRLKAIAQAVRLMEDQLKL